jgi:hypothetical protein
MKTGYRYVSFLFLTAALSAPDRDEHRDEHQKRVYDRAARTRTTTTGMTMKTATTTNISLRIAENTAITRS